MTSVATENAARGASLPSHLSPEELSIGELRNSGRMRTTRAQNAPHMRDRLRLGLEARTWRNIMPRSKTHESAEPPQEKRREVKKRRIPASEVGVTLTISDEALRKLDQIQEEAIQAAQDDQKFSWR